MERWSGRVALITGTSSGIGAAIAKELVKNGLKVVGVARRVDRIEELARSLGGEKGKLYPLKADITKEDQILTVFDWIRKNLGGIDILINNAAIAELFPLTDAPTETLKNIFDLNVIGLSICTKEAVKLMREKGVDDGHIIHVNSVAGHYIATFPGSYPYTASKHAVTALAEGLRRELVQQQSKIKITSLSPGAVDTEMLQKAKSALPPGVVLPELKAEDIANAVIYILGTPPHVQVTELIIRPVGEPL